MLNDIRSRSAVELRDAIAAGDLTSAEATRAFLDAINRLEPRISAFNDVHCERAMERAAQIDAGRQAGKQLGPLGGVPIAVTY